MKNILIIEDNSKKFAFRIPTKPVRYRANCRRDFGQFIKGNIKGLNSTKAEKAGFTYGNSVEIAIASISSKVLTFEPHYIQEPFTEIWGFPVSGEMHSRNCKPNSSELITFLIHRRSMDKMGDILADIERDADNAWIDAGMPENIEEFIANKKIELLVNSIFQFEFIPESSKHGDYHWVKCTRTEAKSDLAKAALKCSQQIFELKQTDNSICYDPRLEENHQQNMLLLKGDSQPMNQPQLEAETTK